MATLALLAVPGKRKNSLNGNISVIFLFWLCGRINLNERDDRYMSANRILIVEDDSGIADTVSLNLRYVGYDYLVFDDGRKAVEYLEKDHSFDLALLDIMLPGMDGFELFSYMEKYNIPVIYMTAKTDSESEVRGLRDGAEDYIVKPFEVVTLLVRIEKVLARTGRLNQVYTISKIELKSISNL